MAPGPKAAKPSDELDGVKKAAILLLSLDRQAAAALLSQLPVEMVEEVSRVIATIGEVPSSSRRRSSRSSTE